MDDFAEIITMTGNERQKQEELPSVPFFFMRKTARHRRHRAEESALLMRAGNSG